MATSDVFARQRVPVLIVISGPSGVGKDTVAKRLMDQRDDFYFVVTATTRKPREGEVHGQDYFFVSHDEFAQMIDEDELLEYAVVYNDFKGVPKQQIREALQSGSNVLMRVDVQGAATIRKLVPQAVLIFLTAESEEALVRRLRERETESPDTLNLRIATARKEMERVGEFDYWVVNAEGEQQAAVEQILCIVEAEGRRIGRERVTV